MSEINVLVSGNVTPKGKGGSIPKEENSGTDLAAMEFAAIFGGWMAQAMGQGQDSGLQSSDPAGKEANSGQIALQGSVGTLGLLRTTLLSPTIQGALIQEGQTEELPGAGTMLGIPQGEIAPQTELDEYKKIISTLLREMSGEIREVIPSQRGAKPVINQQELQQVITQLMNLSEGEEQNQGINLNQKFIANPVGSFTPEKPLIPTRQIISQVTNQVQIDQAQTMEGMVSLPQENQSLGADKMVTQGNTVTPNGLNKNADAVINLSSDESANVNTSKMKILSSSITDPNSFEVNEMTKSESKSTVFTTESLLKMPLDVIETSKNGMKNSILKVLKTVQEQGVVLPEALSRVLSNASLIEKVEGQLKVQLGNKDQLAQAIQSTETQKLGDASKQVQIQPTATQNIPEASTQTNIKDQPLTQNVLANQISSNPLEAQDKQQKPFQPEGTSGKVQEDILQSQNNDARLMGFGVNQPITKLDTPMVSKVDSPVWAQVAQEIQQNVLPVRNTLRELDIQLHPAELGHIRIALTWDNGQVHLRMVASEAGTGQALQANLPDLRQSLTGMGIQCGMMQMGFGDQRQNSQQGQERRFMTQIRTDRDNEASNMILPLEIETPIQKNYPGLNGPRYTINVTA